MRSILTGLFLLQSSLHAGIQEQRLQEIKFEMAVLEKQKEDLQQEIISDYRKEMQFEMQSQREFVDYKWHSLGESLRKAEFSENIAHKKEAEIHKIDLRLAQLSKEREFLTEQGKSAK